MRVKIRLDKAPSAPTVKNPEAPSVPIFAKYISSKQYKKKTKPNSITMANPISQTYLYILFMNVVQWFVQLYNKLFRKHIEYKPSILKTESIQYCENAKTKFILFSSRDYKNSNISPVFYDKEQYAKEMEIYNNELELTWKRRVMMEHTPRGNLIMYFDPYKLGFSYYADTFMPYHLLNAAAMKYVALYRCWDFFMDELVNPSNVSALIKIHHTSSKPTKKDMKMDSVFIRPKQKQVTNSVDKITNENKIKNVFIAMGKIANYSILQKQAKQNTFRVGISFPAKQTSWKEYKTKLAPTLTNAPTPVCSPAPTPISAPTPTYDIPKEIDESTMFLQDSDDYTHE